MIARRATRTIFIAALACLLVALAAPAAASAAEFTVDSHVDERDENLSDGICDATVFDGTCTLRAAIEEINHQEASANTIKFDPTAFDDDVPIFVASLLGALPPIEFPTTIEAGSDCEYAEVDGAPCVGVVGLEGEPVFVVEANDTKISGLAITGGSVGIGVYDESTGFEATGNWIGIGLNGSNAIPAAEDGILLGHGSDEATIGGSGAGERNVIAFNEVGLDVFGASHTTVRGNWFGVAPKGVEAGPQTIDIKITNYKPSGPEPEVEAEDNEIGATLGSVAQASAACDGGCNVISGAEEGIELNGNGAPSQQAPASGPTTIRGNYIGLDPTGTKAVRAEPSFPGWEGNKLDGIKSGAASDLTVGGSDTGDVNYFAGESVGITSEDASDFEAKGNVFGETPGGLPAAPMRSSAIYLAASAGLEHVQVNKNRILMGEDGKGIWEKGDGAIVYDNEIEGGEYGVFFEASTLGARGMIDFNTIEDAERTGIALSNSADNEVTGNTVLRAGDSGIEVVSENTEYDGNVIGWDVPGEDNLISDSGGAAISIEGAEGTRNEIRGNHGSGNEGERGFIVLEDVPNEPANGVEEPTIETARKTEATGTAEPHATVRVFYKASAEPGELGGYLGQAEANSSGNWTVTYDAVPGETRITATQTLDGGTSTLAEPVKTPADSKTPVCPEAGATGCETTPPPPSNTSPPPPGPTPDTTKPKVTIKKAPKAKSTSTTAKFVFSSNESGSKFQCKLDNGKFANCKSPKTYKKLKPGKHVFKVKAIDAAGNVSSVVTRKFTVSSA